MFFTEFITAALVAFLLILLLGGIFGRSWPWRGMGWAFLIIFLGAWAIGTWSAPVGPMFYGVAWVPFFFGALVLALLLLAVPSHPRAGSAGEADVEGAAAVAVGAFFWVVVLLLLTAIFWGTYTVA